MAFEEGERRRRQPQQSSSRIREEKQNNIMPNNKSSTSQASINSRKRKAKATEESVRPIKGKKAMTKSQQKTKSKQVKDEAQIALDQLITQGSYEMHNYESDFEKLFKENMIYYLETDDKVNLKKKGANRQIFDKTYLMTRESMQRSGKIALNEEELKRSGEAIKQQQLLQSDTKGTGNNSLQAKLAQLDITTHLLNHTSMLPEVTLDKVENLLKTVSVGSIQEINNMLLQNHNNFQNNVNNYKFNGNSQQSLSNHKIIGLISPLKEALPEGLIIDKSDFIDDDDDNQQKDFKLALTKALAKFNISHPEQPIDETNAQMIAQQNQAVQQEKLALVSAYLQNNSDFSMRKTNTNLYKAPASRTLPTQQTAQQKTQNQLQDPEPSDNNQNLNIEQIQEETHENMEQIPNQGTQLNLEGLMPRLDNSTNKKPPHGGVTIKKEARVLPSGGLKTSQLKHPKHIIDLTSDSQNSQNQQNIQSQESVAGLNVPEYDEDDQDKRQEILKESNQQITKTNNHTPTNKTNISPSHGNFKVESQITQDPSKVVSNPKNIIKAFTTSSPSLSLQQLLFQSPASKQQQIQLQQNVGQSPSVLQKPNPIRPKSLLQSPQISIQFTSPQPQSYLESSLFVPKQLFQSAKSSSTFQKQQQQEQISQIQKTQQFNAISATEKQPKQIKNQRKKPSNITKGITQENNKDALQKLALQQLLQISNAKSDCFNTTKNAISTATDKCIPNMSPTFASSFQLNQSISQPLQQLLQTKMSNSFYQTNQPQPLHKVNGFQQRSIGVSVPIKNQSKMIVLPTGNNQHTSSPQSSFNAQTSTANNLLASLGNVINNLENKAKKDKNTSNQINQSNFNAHEGNNGDISLKSNKNEHELSIKEHTNEKDRNSNHVSLSPQKAQKEVHDASELVQEQNERTNEQEKGVEQIKDRISNKNEGNDQIELENENNDKNITAKDQLDKLLDHCNNNVTNPQSISSSPSVRDTTINTLSEPSAAIQSSKITAPTNSTNNVIIPSSLQIQTPNEISNPTRKNIQQSTSPQKVQPITITIDSSQETTAVANESQEDDHGNNNINNSNTFVNNTSFKNNNNDSTLSLNGKLNVLELSHQSRENDHTNGSQKPFQNLLKKQTPLKISYEVDELKDPQSLDEDSHVDQMEQEQWPFQQLHCLNMEMEQENN